MNYGAINAKVKAMSSKLLKPQDFEAFNQMNSQEIAKWLIRSPIKTDTDIESVLHQTIDEAASRILLYIPDKNQRDYLEAAASPREEGIHFYTAQWKRLARLDKQNRMALRGILGAEIDLTNILWMYRLKRYRAIKGDATYGYLIPIRYKLSRAATQCMAECATAKALLDEVANSPYGSDIFPLPRVPGRQTLADGFVSEKIIPGSYPGKDRLSPEQQIAHAIKKRYQASARRFPDSLASALAYLYKKRLEVQALVSVIMSV